MSGHRAPFQFYIPDGNLSCRLHRRSTDIFLGVPFSSASYMLLTLMIAQFCGLKAGDFVRTDGDCLCSDRTEQARTQLAREPRWLPTVTLNPAVTDLFAFRREDSTFGDDEPYAYIKAPVAV